MNLPARRRTMRGAHLCLVTDQTMQSSGGHGHRRNNEGADHGGVVDGDDHARQRAEWLAATDARVTVLRSATAATNANVGLQHVQPARNFGLRAATATATAAVIEEVEADRSGIEWIDLHASGVRATRELANKLDRLRPDLVHLDPGWLVAGAAATRLLRLPSVVASIDDTTAAEILQRPRLRKVLSVLLTGPNSRAIFSNEAMSDRCVSAGLVRPGRAVVIADGVVDQHERTLDIYAACLGHPPVTLTTN